jgi:hypothetical protein
MRRRALLGAGVLPAIPSPAGGPACPLTWFVWHAEPWLAQPARMLARLPPGTRRILLGLNGAQLHAAAGNPGRERVNALLAAAHALQLRVDLLLGDPHWVTPAGRQRLLALLDLATGLPFDGLNLDLERHQLRGMPQAAWQAAVTATLNAVGSARPGPLALTTHYLDLTEPTFAGALAAAGADELVPMIYVSFEHLVRERAAAVLAACDSAGAPLRITVAQSIERQLARGESWRREGRAGALSAWQRLDTALRERDARFDGIAVQSFEEFESAA